MPAPKRKGPPSKKGGPREVVVAPPNADRPVPGVKEQVTLRLDSGTCWGVF